MVDETCIYVVKSLKNSHDVLETRICFVFEVTSLKINNSIVYTVYAFIM